jgi:acyl-CoA synthetase (AMP-forming)/AMP-acid ligase II
MSGMTRLLSETVLAACRRFADRIAITDVPLTWTYAEFAAQIEAWAALLGGEDAPRRIGFVLKNSAQYLAAMYGAVLAGKVPFLIDDSLGAGELGALAAAVELDAVLTTDAAASLGQVLGSKDGLRLTGLVCGNGATRMHDGTALCRFTSGTSGIPKCLEFSHEAILNAARVWGSSNGLHLDDRIVCLSGFFNGLAFNTSLTATFLSGARLSIYRGWASPAQVLRHAAREGATRLVGFPAFYQLLAESDLAQDSVPPSLCAFYSAASRLSDETRQRLRETRGITVIDYYGIAEAGPVTTERSPGVSQGNGTALESCEIRVRNGMLEVRTPYLATRYLNKPGALESQITPDGFYMTSDAAQIVDGRLFLGPRKQTLLDVGGRKFPASDVRDALMALPGVTDAYVFGEPVPDRGTRVLAAVAAAFPADERSIRADLATRIARYKVPQAIRILKSMPLNEAGKIDAVYLRSLFMKGNQEHV